MGFLISDVIFLGFVSTCYLTFSSKLYKYTYFKSIICTLLLIFNFGFLGYGAYIIANIPSVLNTQDSTINQ